MGNWWEEPDAVLHYPANQRNFWLKVRILGPDDCWLWQASTDKDGYGHYRSGSKIVQTDRQAYILTKGPIPKGLIILHSCDRPPCCNPRHLDPGTHLDNMLDMVSKNRENNGIISRLEPKDILRCRQAFWYEGILASDLAGLFNLPVSTMDSLVLGRSWSKIHPFCGLPASFHHLRGRESIPFCEKHKETMGKFFPLKRNGVGCRFVMEE